MSPDLVKLLEDAFAAIQAEGHRPDDAESCSRCEVLARIERFLGRELTKNRRNSIIGVEIERKKR